MSVVVNFLRHFNRMNWVDRKQKAKGESAKVGIIRRDNIGAKSCSARAERGSLGDTVQMPVPL